MAKLLSEESSKFSTSVGRVGTEGHQRAGGGAGDDREQGGARDDIDTAVFGRRLRHVRTSHGLTLAALGERVGLGASALSQLENGHREPRLSLLTALARALETDVEDLVSARPPTRRAELEIAVEQAQQDPLRTTLGLPRLKIGRQVPTAVLEHLSALYTELREREERPPTSPGQARGANAELRRTMREQGNYFPEVERLAARTLRSVGYTSGPLSEALLASMTEHAGLNVRYVTDLPHSVRSIVDLKHRRVYVERSSFGMHTPRTVLLQTLGHVLLGHQQPADFAGFLRQRVEANYFAAAVLLPEQEAVPFLRRAKAERDLSVEDLRDSFAVSYEMAAHRFTNLATQHLDLTCHFGKNDEDGTIHKAYENDGLVCPSDTDGGIEGQRMCRNWAGRAIFSEDDRFSVRYQYTDTPNATYWCAAHVDPGRERNLAITLGVPYRESRWFRGRDTSNRVSSACPDGPCCRGVPADLASRWDGLAWPSARVHAHSLATIPPGAFPGVDTAEVYAFLEHRQGR